MLVLVYNASENFSSYYVARDVMITKRQCRRPRIGMWVIYGIARGTYRFGVRYRTTSHRTLLYITPPIN